MRAHAVIYPVAGGGRARKIWPAVEQRLAAAGAAVTASFAEHRTHGIDLAEAAARAGNDVVIAVGGDGTLHWVVNGLMRVAEPRPPLGIIPAGTGSDFAAALGIAPEPLAAVDVIVAGRRRRVDLGQVHGRYFATIGTVGFGGEVAQQVARWSERVPPAIKAALPGPIIYLAGILKMLVVYGPVMMELRLNGHVRRERFFMIGVGNTLRAAGGMKLCPGASPDDGLFEVIPIGDVTKLEVLRLLPQTFSGRHVTHPKVDVETAATVTVSSESPLTVQADGEIVGRVPATFTVARSALEVLAPPPGGPPA